MNMFILANDIPTSAYYHSDPHVVKMPIEAAQIVSTAIATTWSALYIEWRCILYKPTHQHHPLVKWASECGVNAMYVADYGVAVAEQYTRRYGKCHKSLGTLKLARLLLRNLYGPVAPEDFTLPPLCMPKVYQTVTAPITIHKIVECYRDYYASKPNTAIRYCHTPMPEWIALRRGT